MSCRCIRCDECEKGTVPYIMGLVKIGERFQEALSIIRSAQTSCVYNEAKAFIEKVEGDIK